MKIKDVVIKFGTLKFICHFDRSILNTFGFQIVQIVFKKIMSSVDFDERFITH